MLRAARRFLAPPQSKDDRLIVEKFRLVGGAVLLLILFGGAVALEVDAWWESRAGADIVGRVDPSLPNARMDLIAPNMHHIWGSAVPHLVIRSGDGKSRLSMFGLDARKLKPGDWPKLCVLDSDGDGATNGEELGDPCCTWVPGKVPPYRVWNLSHPGHFEEGVFLLTEERLQDLVPSSCPANTSSPEFVKDRQTMFDKQYTMRHELDTNQGGDALWWLKYILALVILGVLGHWVACHGLLRDLFGVGPAAPHQPSDLARMERVVIYVAAYYWTDGIAGLTHLTFDFCPQWYPIIGSVARGFQFHHFHPTAWVVVPLPMMLSHALPLLGTLSCALTVIPPRRRFRAFWALTMFLCVLTVLTHRWVHTPPEEQFWWFALLQRAGLLMSHEHHMKHHDSLVTQFSNLSGVTDFVLDYIASNWLPPTSYQHWLLVVLLYFSIPIAWGAERRSSYSSVAASSPGLSEKLSV